MKHLITTFLFLFITNLLFCQYAEIDTIKPEKNVSDSNKIKFMHIPSDAQFIPSYILYNHNWNNMHVRLNKYNFWSYIDTFYVFFNHDTSQKFVFPVEGKLLSPFGKRGRRIHSGIDISAKLNQEVVAAFDGVVRIAKPYHGYGNFVVIRHSNGLETTYAHLNKIKCKTNQNIKAGSLVGLAGHTGRATCVHLHFETRFLEDAFDPLEIIDMQNKCLKSDTLVITQSTFSKSKYLAKTKKKQNTNIQKDTNNIAKDTNDITLENVPNNSNSTKNHTVYHKIRSGDTLYSLALKNSTTVDAICKLNNIKRTKILSLGQRIRIR